MPLSPELVRPVGSGSVLGTGKGILITGNNAGATVVLHQGVDRASMRRVWIWVNNVDPGVSHKLYIRWGGTDATMDYIPVQVRPEQGPQVAVPGLLLQDDLLVDAFADTANMLVCYVAISNV